MKNLIAMGGLLILLSGCGLGKSPPMDFETWVKEGETATEIRKAVLECGSHNPFSGSFWPGSGLGSDRVIDYENAAKVDLCMQKNGYVRRKGSRFQSLCELVNYQKTEACKPENAHLIPDRDPKVRLNSKYCRDSLYATYPACQP